jgi:hypothetical protein
MEQDSRLLKGPNVPGRSSPLAYNTEYVNKEIVLKIEENKTHQEPAQ